MRLFAIALLVTLAGCGDDPVGAADDPASVQIDAIEQTFDGNDTDRYALSVSNHGERPGTFKIQAWGRPLNQPNSSPEMWGETDPATVDADYAEDLEITVPNRTGALVVLTRPENSAVFVQSDSVDLTGL